ncbi:MAG: neutral zinc metallopeptidase [Proteobacteria bacterium]|uniref:KPN_02809 family neutral zinc metallopeptidase n=1 Tax=Aquabacterium sp. TaxID=1872578 RepID=UPI0035C6AF53|nr:neutral zinc metallopeptidase [Pseudomonadota bacterium]
MRLDGQRESENVDDVRDADGGGRGGGLPGLGGLGGGRLGLGTVAIALVASYFLGVNPMTVLSVLSGGGPIEGGSSTQVQRPQPRATPAEDPGARFVRQVLATTEDVWQTQFQAHGARYPQPRLTLFRGSTPTACGRGEAAMGPFYCPADHRVYIDLAFYDTLRERLGAPGDFAQAYVIAHEVGHHVQNLQGTSEKLDRLRGRVSEAQYNAASVRLELQADCYAGIWAHDTQQAKGLMESGDLEEALNAASQIGDDTLQRETQGRVVPETFTHGSSAQRVRWFKRGFETGDMAQCDTFNTRAL